ncbi:MAG: aminomethyltransferase beta-barrel domain-containing protein, partial [Polynucleobacter sp.]
RKGIGMGGSKDGTGDPWFVAKKDIQTNTLYIVQGHEHPWLLNPLLNASQISWTSDVVPDLGSYSAKTRYRQADAPCELTSVTGDLFTLNFEEAQWAVTPGQSAVIYSGDRCLGGGIITN